MQVSVLDRLEANLRAEQRSLAELDFLLFTQLLTPIQARRMNSAPDDSSSYGSLLPSARETALSGTVNRL